MKPHIYCKATEKGQHTFYLIADGREYYLFSQNYRKGVHAYFAKGIRIDDVHDFSKSKHDRAVIRTLDKLPVYIKYVESEYGIAIRKQTIRKLNHAQGFGKIPA